MKCFSVSITRHLTLIKKFGKFVNIPSVVPINKLHRQITYKVDRSIFINN